MHTDGCGYAIFKIGYVKGNGFNSRWKAYCDCEYNGILCNPMLLPKRYYGRAKQLCNDKGAKQIIGDDTYLTVSLSEEEFMDIDEKTEAI